MRQAECIAGYLRLVGTMNCQEIARVLGITPGALAHHLRRARMSGHDTGYIPRGEFLDRYTSLVKRCPEMLNDEIAKELGTTPAALIQRLARARRAGLLTLYRVSFGHRPELAPPGLTGGYVPALVPRRRRKKDLDRAA